MTQIDAQGNQMGNYAYVNPEGNIQETSEVAAARVAHIAAHAVALAAAKKASSSQESRNTPQPKEAVPLPQPTWTLPVQPLSTPAVHQTWFIPYITNWVKPHPILGYMREPVQEPRPAFGPLQVPKYILPVQFEEHSNKCKSIKSRTTENRIYRL